MMTNIFAKILFGTRYEKLIRTLIVSLTIFMGIYYSGIKISIADFIIYLMITSSTTEEMFRALGSEDNKEDLKHILMLPVNYRTFGIMYVPVLGVYVVLSRTLPIAAIVFAVSSINTTLIINVLLCVVNSVLLATGIYVWKKIRIFMLAWLVCIIAVYYFFSGTFQLEVILIISIVILLFAVLRTDAYAFYQEKNGSNLVSKGKNRHNVWVYFFRYISAHKNYLFNEAIILSVAVILPVFYKDLLRESPELLSFLFPVGFAILSLNTPICILLSCDHSLEQAVRYLPGQKKAFFTPYCLFIFACNMLADILYLISMQLQIGGVTKMIILAAVFFAMQSAVLSVFLECFYPIKGWKIENELWHNGRKYIVPVVMVLLSGLVGLVPVMPIILMIVLILELIVLMRAAN